MTITSYGSDTAYLRVPDELNAESRKNVFSGILFSYHLPVIRYKQNSPVT